ncbi:MAG: hypothetical protein AAFY48_04320 [Bacteroidota bacterium]
MAKSAGIPPLAWAGLGLVVFLIGKNAVTNLVSRINFGTPRINLGEFTFSGVDAEIFIPISSQLPTDVPIEWFEGRLVYGQFEVARVFIPQAIQIISGDTTTLRTRAQIRYVNLSHSLISLIQSGQFVRQLRLVGVLRAGGVNWPINQNLSVA